MKPRTNVRSPKAVQATRKLRCQDNEQQHNVENLNRGVEPTSTTDERLTLVKAKVDVGLGNSLYIRGEGGGLSWNHGQPLTCVDTDQWIWSTQHAQGKAAFKLLLNDQIWALGENMVLEPGRILEVAPRF